MRTSEGVNAERAVNHSPEKFGQHRQGCAVVCLIDHFSAISKEDELIGKTFLLAEQWDNFMFDFLQELLTDSDFKQRETLRAYIGLSLLIKEAVQGGP